MTVPARNQRRRGGQKREREDGWHADAREPTTMSNAAFDAYYKGKIIREEEWESFIACLRTPLPLSLRVNLSLPEGEAVADMLFKELSQVFATTRLPFYPKGFAMQSEASRGELKRNVEHKRIKKLIAALNEGGYLTRQETVSMIPPLLLNVQPGDRVLDMCSAPGSKTSQILEALVGAPSTGCVVANDVNSSRLDVLNHQTNRCPGAHAHIVITNFDAMNYPLVSDASHKFDRVLCDVMCSGDGTLRKSVDLWARWNTVQGADLHASQCRVLTRGMQLCKKGGVVVYSTCSLNPVEDEAVLSDCIARSKGSFRLMDASALVKGLKGEPGLTRAWTLTSKDLERELSSFAAANAYREEKEGKGFLYRASMFANETLLQQQNMQYALRVLPHAQDTGGFFIAALECVDEYPDSVRPPPSSPADKPYKFISETLKGQIQRALGLPDTFPYSNLYVRNEDAREQKIYYACDAVKAMLPHLHANIAQVGAKIFEGYAKHNNEKLRFSAEGLGTLVPLLPDGFIFDVPHQVILDMCRIGMDLGCFCTRAGIAQDDLPCHSFVLKCPLPDGLGALFVAAERQGTLVTAKVLEWQQVLCKLAAGQPIVDVQPTAADGDGEEGNNDETADAE